MKMIAKLEWKVTKTKEFRYTYIHYNPTLILLSYSSPFFRARHPMPGVSEEMSVLLLDPFLRNPDQRTEVLRAPCRDFRPVILIKNS